MTTIPTLETDRLFLRTPLFEDLEPMVDFFQNSGRAKFVGGPMDKGEVWRALLRAAGHWHIRGGSDILWTVQQAGCADTQGICIISNGPRPSWPGASLMDMKVGGLLLKPLKLHAQQVPHWDCKRRSA